MKRTVLFAIMAICIAHFLVACGKTENSQVQKKENITTGQSETWEPEKVSTDTAGKDCALEGHNHEGHEHAPKEKTHAHTPEKHTHGKGCEGHTH